MKKVFNKFNFALVAMLIAAPAFAAGGGMDGLCALITSLQGIFRWLRILAFVGAGFFIATWAWGYISDPKDGKDLIGDIKKKGTGMLVGFLLLFMIGVILTAVINMAGAGGMLGCAETALAAW